MTSTLTGRRQAATVAAATRTTDSWTWVLQAASSQDRLRRAAARRIARLTDTEPVQWQGELDTDDWQTVLSAGADALLARAAGGEFGLDLVVAAEELLAEAAATTDAESGSAPVPGRAVEAAAEHERTPVEEAEISRWSPFRKDRSGRDPRGCYVIRCADGSRRYPNGDLAD
ncbi:hypothetical protein [Kitasatospora griseola]|uniref:hypothetical protein n=1 Tax=Kitasatospora griseola TaxID=2064 RepID=UPI0037F66D5C